MPIYEYEALDSKRGCNKCATGFEVLQRVDEAPLTRCPNCGQSVRKVISWCRAAVVETSDRHLHTMERINDYERQGMWSHAAELADKHSEKIKDKSIKMRALDNYKKAGYDVDSLAKHVNLKDN